MAYQHTETQTSISSSHLNGFRIIFVVTFMIFLLMAMVGQLFAWNWRTWLPGAEGTRSIFESVNSAVYTVISQLR